MFIFRHEEPFQNLEASGQFYQKINRRPLQFFFLKTDGGIKKNHVKKYRRPKNNRGR